MKSLWIVSSLIVYLYAWFGFSADIVNHDSEVILFIGNPGVGKSTLINSIVGQHVAESGVNPGEGLTKLFQSYYHQGKTYIDTPGLSDTKIGSQAAKEIEKALKMNNNYRIFFMLTLSAGRVKTDDVKSINRIMESVKSANKSFNIIINKINKKELAEIFKNQQAIEEVYTQINSGNNKTISIFYIEIDRNIEEEDTEFIVIDEKLNQFLHQDSLSFFLDKKDVAEIDSRDLEELRRNQARQEELVREQLREQQRRTEELRQEIERKAEELRRAQNYCSYDWRGGGCSSNW